VQTDADANKHAQRVVFRNQEHAEVGGGEDILIEDVRGDHVDLARSYAPDDTVYIRRATLWNLDMKALRLGLPRMVYEDCLFENIKTDELELREAIFRRCTSRNVRIRKELSHWSQRTRFEGCTFENVHRDAGVEIRRFLDPHDPKWTPYTNQRLPWESGEEWQWVQKK